MPVQIPRGKIWSAARRNDNPSTKVLDGKRCTGPRHNMFWGAYDARDKDIVLHDSIFERCTVFEISAERYAQMQEAFDLQGDAPFLDRNGNIIPSPFLLNLPAIEAAGVKDIDGGTVHPVSDAADHVWTKPLDLSRVGDDCFADATQQQYTVTDLTDRFAISSGTHLYGTGGEPYPDLNSAGGLLPDIAAAMTGALKGTRNTDVTESVAYLWGSDISGHDFELDSANPFVGDPRVASSYYHLSAARLLQLSPDATGGGTITVQGNTFYGGRGVHTVRLANIAASGGTCTIVIEGNLFIGNPVGSLAIGLLAVNLENVVLRVLSNNFYAHTQDGMRLNNNLSGCTFRPENNTSDGDKYGYNFVNTLNYSKNNTGYNPAGGAVFYQHGASNSDSDTSSDNSADPANWNVGVNDVTGAVFANDVVSTSILSADYTKWKSGSPLDGSGVAGERTVCVRDNAVPGESGYSRGVAENPTPPAVGGLIGTVIPVTCDIGTKGL